MVHSRMVMHACPLASDCLPMRNPGARVGVRRRCATALWAVQSQCAAKSDNGAIYVVQTSPTLQSKTRDETPLLRL